MRPSMREFRGESGATSAASARRDAMPTKPVTGKEPPRAAHEERGPDALSKVPPVTLAFWAAKILATTLGETGGDAMSMTLKLGYALSTLVFLAFFLMTLAGQVKSTRYHPAIYWAVVVATTTVGTTTSDYFDRTLELGYVKSSIILFGAVLALLVTWRVATGAIQVDQVTTRKNEIFYWLTILVSNTLGTALGDFVADDAGLGFQRGALVFGALIAVVALLYLFARVPWSIAFWAAYVLTRPLGATLGDTLTKPFEEGGLALGRIVTSERDRGRADRRRRRDVTPPPPRRAPSRRANRRRRSSAGTLENAAWPRRRRRQTLSTMRACGSVRVMSNLRIAVWIGLSAIGCAPANPPPSAPVEPPVPPAAAPLAPSASAVAPVAPAFVSKTIPLPGGGPDGVAMDFLLFDAASSAVWAPAGNTGSVDAIAADTGQLTRIQGFPHPRDDRPRRKEAHRGAEAPSPRETAPSTSAIEATRRSAPSIRRSAPRLSAGRRSTRCLMGLPTSARPMRSGSRRHGTSRFGFSMRRR